MSDFRKNQGFLLASAVAYNTLLSVVPLFVVLLVGLSHFIEQERLLATVSKGVELLLPGRSGAIVDQVAAFLAHRQVIGFVGGVILLFFSSIAFTVLESAMAVIFHHPEVPRRHPLLSAVIPYVFILALGAGLLVITVVGGALRLFGQDVVYLWGYGWLLAAVSGALGWAVGMAGLALLLTALYLVMPVWRISFRTALAGGLSATVLWEIVRRGLAWYFSTLSMVNVLYGSLATSIVVLLTLEVASLIVLLGAQVIAELERLRRARLGPQAGAEAPRR